MKKSFLGVAECRGVVVHKHPKDEPCPGYPRCYRVHLSISSLADSLIQSTLNFVNTKLDHPNQILDFFGGAYTPSHVPKLRACRETQREVREWLTDDSRHLDFYANITCSTIMTDGYEGLTNKSPEFGHIVAEPCNVHLDVSELKQHFRQYGEDIASHGYSLDFTYRFVGATLEELAGYGMAFILQDEKRDRVGICARDGCENIFLDLKSRGTRRKFCKTDECARIVRNERTAKSRSKEK
jgi:hypothetical protein